MGISDWLRPRSTPSGPDDLRGALLDALERKDYERAMRLINDNSDQIRKVNPARLAGGQPARLRMCG